MSEFLPESDARVTCKFILPNGQPCGFVAQGATIRDRIVALHRHQDEHVKAENAARTADRTIH